MNEYIPYNQLQTRFVFAFGTLDLTNNSRSRIKKDDTNFDGTQKRAVSMLDLLTQTKSSEKMKKLPVNVTNL